MVKPGQISSYVSGEFSHKTWPEIWPELVKPGQISGYVKSKFTDQTWPDFWSFLAEASDPWPDVSKEVKLGQTWPDFLLRFWRVFSPDLARFLATLKASLLAKPGQISSYVSGEFSWQT